MPAFSLSTVASLSAPSARWRLPQATLGAETLALIVSAFFALLCNRPFWEAALAGRDPHVAGDWLYAAAILVALTGVQFLILCPLLGRWTAKPLLSLLIVATAFATHYIATFAVYLDPHMLRNVLSTEVKESRELVDRDLVLHVAAYAGLPLLLLWRVRLELRPLMRAALIRFAALTVMGLVTAGAVLLVFQDFSALVRNRKEVRYLVTPANLVYSTARVLTAGSGHAGVHRLVVGADARLSIAGRTRAKPVLFVMVVGETARAANWGLNGYERQTTPRLAQLDVINFGSVKSCGTDTETSVPCMFSAIGRRAYDEDRIRNSDSLLQLLRRAGFRILWRDNNTGCKGVCADFGEERVDRHPSVGECDADRCLDEVLLHGMASIAGDNRGNLFVVLHQIGNHGPAYFKRYPNGFSLFQPTCDTAELRKCDRREIVNSYDNAILYTDHFLAEVITFLRAQQGRYDTALYYVSDHGESLGENGLYLHGIPYSIAPAVQTEVPMVLWLSSGFLRSSRLDESCLRQRARQSASHDNLFHSVLGLLDVETAALDPALDFTRGCRTTSAPDHAATD